MDLDSLLDAAAPPLAARTPELARELTALVDAGEAMARPRRRRRRLAIVGAASALAIGATAATTAAVGPSHWTSWLTSDHKSCQLQVEVGPAGPDVGNGEPRKWPTHIDKARRARLVADAQAFLAGFDYAAVDHEAAVRAYQVEENKIIAHERATEPADEVQPRLTGADLTSAAITTWVLDRLDQHLAAEGYDMSLKKGSDLYLMSSMTETRCDQ